MPHGMTWFNFLPGYEQLAAFLRHSHAQATLLGPTAFAVQHVFGALLVLIVLMLLALVANRRLANLEANIVPDGKLGLLAALELVVEALYGISKDIIGPETKRYFPLIGTLALYIFFCNALGLIPGFEPPTNNVSTNAACALFVFFYYNYQGLRVNGLGHITHMANPMGSWWGWFLAPLMFPVELIGHLARPLSLTLRLFGNMVGDHAVVLGFAGMIPLLVPIPFQALGLLVCVIQALVFCLLTATYIGMATAAQHEEEQPAH
ncbi:MAG: F0F1 ATP synthase subunit A [Deltaproteobacteria bacterium]|nr:F0F1 ATP synthase subunit A [Deltaproteobacteria bacterium]